MAIRGGARRLRPLTLGLALITALVVLPAQGALAGTDRRAPSAPGNLRVVDRQLTTITLDWDAASDNVGVTYYRISYNDDESVDFTTATEYRLWRLEPGRDFRVRVAALDGSGNRSPASEVSTSTLADDVPPTTPELRIAGQSATSVRLAWTPASDDDGGCCGLVYLVDDGTNTREVRPSTSLLVTGLATNRDYTFTIRARDRSGNVSAATQASTRLENIAPSPPSNVRQTGTADGQAVFGWDPATDDSGMIVEYIVSFHTGEFRTSGLSVAIADLIADCLLPEDPDLVRFSVVARDLSGNLSAPAIIDLPVV